MFTFDLPEDFLLGTANSAFQSEGASDRDGKSESIIDHYARLYAGKPHPVTGKLLTELAPEDGCFFYDNYEAYIEDMAKTGQNVYRMSLAWPRILPEGTGKVNPKGIDFYNKVIDKLIACGITPFVDLLHVDLPQCLVEQGGFANPAFPEWFEAYARTCFEAFGDRVKLWSTFNEAEVSVGKGYGAGRFPPYIRDRQMKMHGVHYLVLAHFRAVRACRELVPDGKIGVVHCLGPCYPADPGDQADVEAAERARMHSFDLYMEPMAEGTYPEKLLKEIPQIREALPQSYREELQTWFAPMDFVGINYYTVSRVRYSPDTLTRSRGADNFYSAPGQRFVPYPAGLLDAVLYVWERYRIPIYISENGCALETDNVEEHDCHDAVRIEYLREHLRMVARSIRVGVDLRGYFYWNDADSYETQTAYFYRFGLTWVDRATGRRRWKDSRHYFSRICKSHKVD